MACVWGLTIAHAATERNEGENATYCMLGYRNDSEASIGGGAAAQFGLSRGFVPNDAR